MKRKALSLCLALCLAMSLLPAGVLAAGMTPGLYDEYTAYPVEGGNLYFDKSTGKIVDSDRSITAAEIPEWIGTARVTGIGSMAFTYRYKMTRLTLPDSVREIEERAFSECTGLTELKLPESLTTIGSMGFGTCTHLTGVLRIPAGVTSIGASAFSENRLTEFTVDPANPNYCAVDGVLFSKDRTKLIAFPGGRTGEYRVPAGLTGYLSLNSSSLTSIVLPEGMTEIGNWSLSYCEDLTSVTIPASVTAIGNSALLGCERLEHVYFTGTPAQWSAVRIEAGNEVLENAEIHCGYVIPGGPVITDQPKSASADAGSKVTFSVQASGEGLTYQWYYKNKTASTFAKAACTAASYTFTATAALDGRQLYCVVTDQNGDTAKSAAVTLTVNTPKVSFTAQPASVTADKGSKVTFTAKAAGDGVTYQWYYKNKTAGAFTKSACTTASYSFTAVAATDGRQLYCVAADKNGNTAKSDTVTLTVKTPKVSITAQPVSQTADKGSKAAFTVKASGEGLTYQWYYKNKTASTFTKSACTAATYSFTAVAATDGRQLYCLAADKDGNTAKSETVTLTLK